MGIRDVIIIGSGPAGLSAALTLKIRNKDVLVIGNSRVSSKLEKAHEINNYLGFPAVKGSELAAAFSAHAAQLGVDIEEDQILSVYVLKDKFTLISKSDKKYEARSIILASGASFGKPYKGEEQFLGRGVSYCATCDAPFYRGKKVVVIASSAKEEAEAEYLAELTSELTFIPLYKEEPKLSERIRVLRDVPLEIKGEQLANLLVLQNGELEADGIFILRESVSPVQLVPGLELEENHVAVNRKMETNIPGLFACGDISGAPYQYIKAAGEGNIAALSAVKYLDQSKKE